MEGECGKLSPLPLPEAKEGSTCLHLGVAVGLGGELGPESFVSYFRSFFHHMLVCFQKIFFLILEKHGSENNSSAALDIKMKNN